MGEASQSNLVNVARSLCDSKGFGYEDLVGEGAFKGVFRIKKTNDEEYALKIIKGPIGDNRTTREVEALQKCVHPNIGKLLSVGTHDFKGTSYTFMLEEFLSGGNLTQRLDKLGLLNGEDLFNIGLSLIDAIGYLDSLGLVHRDIKPDNVMFRADGKTPVLVDFNLVRDLSAASLTQSWLNQGPGTPYFAAPEQLNNQKRLIDWRTDQFALGITLSFASFGIHPYQDASEPKFSPKTVERVALRGHRDINTLQRFEKAGFYCLNKMTNCWPVERFRRPDELKIAWSKRKPT